VAAASGIWRFETRTAETNKEKEIAAVLHSRVAWYASGSPINDAPATSPLRPRLLLMEMGADDVDKPSEGLSAGERRHCEAMQFDHSI
jgi:hypothetical protein